MLTNEFQTRINETVLAFDSWNIQASLFKTGSKMKRECSRSQNGNNDKIGKTVLLSPHISHSDFFYSKRDFVCKE